MMKKINTLLFLIYFFSFPMRGAVQSYIFHHWGLEDGMSNSLVVDMVQDKHNYFWIATEAGLSRFDGRTFQMYDTNNSDIAGNSLNTLLYDRETDKLWIGTKSGVSILNCVTQRFEFPTPFDSLKMNNNIMAFSLSTDGIWIANRFGKLIHYNKTTKQAQSYSRDNMEGLPGSFLSLCDNKKGKLYIGHVEEGMSILDLKTKKLKHYRHDPGNPESLPGDRVYSIYIDHLENIWVGTHQGLALFNPLTEKFHVFRYNPHDPNSLISDHIYEITEMNDNELWIATDIGGISILDLRSISYMNSSPIKFKNITATYNQYGLSSKNIRSLLQDSYGNIWIGNHSRGIDFIGHTSPLFRTLPYMELGIKYKSVNGVYVDNYQQIWFANENEIAVFKGGTLIKTFDLTPLLTRPYARINSILEDGDDLLFGLYDDGLLKLNCRTSQISRIASASNKDIYTQYKAPDGKIWMGSKGIYTYEKGEFHKQDGVYKEIQSQSIFGILYDKQGNLWIGTYGAGIYIYDRNDHLLQHISTAEGFCSNVIHQFYMDKQGGVWVATRHGIGYFEDTRHPEQFKNYRYQQGLENIYIHALQEYQMGNIWFSTDKGISMLNRKRQTMRHYDFRDGIPLGSFLDGCTASSQDGTLYFGSQDGVCYFHPEDVFRSEQVSPVRILECRSVNSQDNNREEEVLIADNKGTIHLPYDQNSFSIAFSIPDFSQINQVEYSYLIEGASNTWTSIKGENLVTFRNLPSGQYRFKVKARLRKQPWDETNIAAMNISIHPPVWLTWYAKIFYLLLLLSGVFFWLRSYKRKLALESVLKLEKEKSRNEQELNNERLRFYTNITHELRTPLTLILGPLEDLADDPKIPEAYNRKIKTIHDSALRLLNLINQLLEFRKTETQNRQLCVLRGDLGRLITEIGLRYKELNRNDKVKIHIRIETKDTFLYFDNEIIHTILNNLLSNALKYTPEGDIILTMRDATEADINCTEILVSDTGYGIGQEELPHIFERYYQAKGKHQASGTGIGLALVKSLVELHEGTLEVKSEVGKGTIFSFRLLKGNEYPNALHKEETAIETGKKDAGEEVNILAEEEDTDNLTPLILAIEDNDDIREYIAGALGDDYRVITACNGQEGLKLAQAQIPDIIVSDIMMPFMDGIELCRKIKEDMRTSHIPVILLTAKNSIQDKEEGYESGADSYLTKPFSAKLLRARIHNLLESRKQLSQLIANRFKETILVEKNMEEGQNTMQETLALNPLDHKFLDKFTYIIEENITSDDLDMSFLQDKMGMSHSTIYRKVKGLTGISANKFIQKIRLKHAMKLLQEGGVNSTEAAYASGFNNVSYFAARFKKEYGVLPSYYMKKKELHNNL